jgi:hypothetical protein
MSELAERFHNGEASNDELLEEIKTLGAYLGLQTISDKARALKTDYNNVKKSAMRKENLFGVVFVIDND